MMDFREVVIIGAPRSGTNMLRDVLTELPGVATWPCDEINYIWRHRNVRVESDELSPELARPEVRRYIRRRFGWVARTYRARTVVEKTCANSLRIPFVDRVVPDARYLFIRRNGFDAVASAVERWKAKLEVRYLARKARFVPLSDLPYYAIRYLGSRVHRLVSPEGRVATWGPRFEGLPEALAELSLEEVCAIQWRRCVDQAAEAFSTMPPTRWLEISYEDFVRAPNRELARVVEFLELRAAAPMRRQAVASVRSGSVGKGRSRLPDGAVRILEPLMHETMARLGYS